MTEALALAACLALVAVIVTLAAILLFIQTVKEVWEFRDKCAARRAEKLKTKKGETP